MTPRCENARGSGDAGAGLVEFALVLPLLTVLVLGIMDFGFAWRESSRLERAVSSAARTGASLANYKYTDFEILKSIDSSTAGVEAIAVQQVVVYKTDVDGGPPPADCTDGTGVADLCNVYDASMVSDDSAESGFPGRAFSNPTSCGSGWDANWCPMSPPPPAAQSRERRRPNNDYIGVWVEAEYDGVTSLIPGTLTLDKYAVFAVEPCFKGDSNCVGF